MEKSKEITIQKGEESNKLMVMKELLEPLREGFFERVVDEKADSARRIFGVDHKIVATKNFTVKLIISYED